MLTLLHKDFSAILILYEIKWIKPISVAGQYND